MAAQPLPQPPSEPPPSYEEVQRITAGNGPPNYPSQPIHNMGYKDGCTGTPPYTVMSQAAPCPSQLGYDHFYNGPGYPQMTGAYPLPCPGMQQGYPTATYNAQARATVINDPMASRRLLFIQRRRKIVLFILAAFAIVMCIYFLTKFLL